MSTTRQNRITIGKLTANDRLSEETLAMACDILFDGKKVGHARNDGRGGITCCDPYEGTVKAFRDAEAFAATLQVLRSDGTQDTDHTGKPAFATLDLIVDELAGDEHLRKKVSSSLKRSLKTKTVFLHGGEEWTFKHGFSPQVKAHLAAKYPGAIFLNELPFEQAVEKSLEQIAEKSKAEAARWEKELESREAARKAREAGQASNGQ